MVDVVAVQVVRDHPLRLGLHPRGDEGREVAHRDAVEHELLAQQAHRVGGRHPGLRQPVVRRLADQEGVAVETRIGTGVRAPLVGEDEVSGRWLSDIASPLVGEPTSHRVTGRERAVHHPYGMTAQRTARAASRRVGGTGLTARAIAFAAREASMPR